MPAAKQLTDYLMRHRGDTAWVFGKGPSLDTFDFAKAGPLRLGINDVVGVVPDCLYGVSGDHVKDWIDLYKPGMTLFHPLKLVEEGNPVPDNCDVCLYREEHGDDKLLDRSRAEMCEYLQMRRGSIGRALQILHIMGVRRIHCVGIDGGRKLSGVAKWRTDPGNTHPDSYNSIRDHFILGAARLGIALAFENGGTPMKDGTARVRMTRDIFVRCKPYQKGCSYTLLEPDAKAAVESGGAVWDNSPIETATAEPAMETPEKTARPRRKRKAKAKA